MSQVGGSGVRLVSVSKVVNVALTTVLRSS